MKKHLLLLFTCGALALPQANASVIYGYQAFEPAVAKPFRGPICFDSATPNQPTHIADCSSANIVYSGYYINYHWYGQAIVNGTTSTVDGLYDINLATGERTLVTKGGSKLIDMTYDYSTGNIYGIRNGSRILGKFNPATGENEALGIFNENGSEVYMIAIEAALDGTLYGVSTSDKFYKIDPSDASLTLVGDLTVDAAFDQSMAFDHNTGTLYWVNNGDYCLYTIDTATGKASLIGPVGKNELSSMASLFIPYINVAEGAPDRVTDVKAIPGETSVTLSWTNPITDARGEKLEELTGVKILRDGTQVADLSGDDIVMGETGTYTDAGLDADRQYSYALVPYNSKGDGGVDDITTKARTGKDLPGAVTNLQATRGDGSAVLSWIAPTEGMFGGKFDPADIIGYEIKRSNTILATVDVSTLSYEDKTDFGTYTYTVTALSDAGPGTPASIENVLVKPGDWIIMCNSTEILEAGKAYKFYDAGGPDAAYRNSADLTLTLKPAKAGDYVCVNFTFFEIDTYGDYLTIYDGPDTESPCIGEFTAMNVPEALKNIEASGSDGSLTFVFTSDLIFAESGWEADVAVKTRMAYDLEATVLKAKAMTIANKEAEYIVTISNKGLNAARDYKVRLLASGKTLAEAQGEAIEPSKSTTVKLKYTPAEAGVLELTAAIEYEVDSNTDNNVTAVQTQNVLSEGTEMLELAAEEENATYVEIIPISFMAYESISEVLISADKLESATGLYLMGISYPLVDCTETYKSVPLRIWAGSTDAADLVDDIVPASQLTKVYDSVSDIISGSESIDFFFSTPVQYNSGNMAVMVHKMRSNTNNYGVQFRGCYGYEHTHDNMSRFDSKWYADDDTNFDPDEKFGYSSGNILPDMVLLFSKSVDGIADVAIGTDGLSVKAVPGGIASDMAADVYNVSGMCVAHLNGGDSSSLAPGMYLVRTAAGTYKIAVE